MGPSECVRKDVAPAQIDVQAEQRKRASMPGVAVASPSKRYHARIGDVLIASGDTYDLAYRYVALTILGALDTTGIRETFHAVCCQHGMTISIVDSLHGAKGAA